MQTPSAAAEAPAIAQPEDPALDPEPAPEQKTVAAASPDPSATETLTPQAGPAPAGVDDPAPEDLPAETAKFDPVALPPTANDGTTRFGIEIGSAADQSGLRPLWREYLSKHAALVAGLQPRRVLAPDKKWRLIAGPFSNAVEAAQACTLFKKADRPCEATVYAGDSL